MLVSPQHCILMMLNDEMNFTRAIHLARAQFACVRLARGKTHIGYPHRNCSM